MVTRGSDGARLWDLRRPLPQAPYQELPVVTDHAVSSDSRWLYATRSGNKGYLWRLDEEDFSSNPVVFDRPNDTHSGLNRFSPDGRWLVTPGYEGAGDRTEIRAVTPDGVSSPRKLTGHTKTVSAIQFSRDGRVIATGSHDKTVKLWEPDSDSDELAPRASLEVDASVQSVAVSLSGRYVGIGTGMDDQKLTLWNTQAADQSTTQLLSTHHTVWNQEFTVDGRWLIAHLGGFIRLWDVRADDIPSTARSIGETTNGSVVSRRRIRDFAVSNGRTLVTAGDDRIVRLWDLKAEEPTAQSVELHGHTAGVAEVDISPDGRWLLSHSNSELLVWDLESPSPQLSRLEVPLPATTRESASVSIAANRTHVVVEPVYKRLGTGSNGKLVVWRLSKTDLVRKSLEVAGRPLTNTERRMYLHE